MRLYNQAYVCNTTSADIDVKSRCLGFSLVNILVSMTLGLVILAAALHWYQVLKLASFSEKNKRQTLDIGRTVFQFMRHDLHACGYRGYRTQDRNFPLRRHFPEQGGSYPFLRFDRPVFGFRAEIGRCQRELPLTFCEQIKEKSDVLIIYHIPKNIILLNLPSDSQNDAIFVKVPNKIQQNSVVLISDIFQGDIFIANDVKENKIFHQKGLNTTDTFSKAYKTDTEVTELQTVVYYLAVPKRQTQSSVTYSLFRSDMQQRAEELVEGIVNFSVEYGYFERKKGMQYYSAEQIKAEQWPLINMVRVKIETKKETWEYAFAIRNGHRINSGSDITDCHLTHLEDEANAIDNQNFSKSTATIIGFGRSSESFIRSRISHSKKPRKIFPTISGFCTRSFGVWM